MPGDVWDGTPPSPLSRDFLSSSSKSHEARREVWRLHLLGHHLCCPEDSDREQGGKGRLLLPQGTSATRCFQSLLERWAEWMLPGESECEP